MTCNIEEVVYVAWREGGREGGREGEWVRGRDSGYFLEAGLNTPPPPIRCHLLLPPLSPALLTIAHAFVPQRGEVQHWRQDEEETQRQGT